MLIINGFLIAGYVLFFVLTRNYKKNLFRLVNKKEEKMVFLYPGCFFLYEKVVNLLKKDEKLKTKDIVFICRKIAISLFILFIFQLLSFGAGIKELKANSILKGRSIERPEYGQGSFEVPLTVGIEDEEGVMEKNIVLEVKERELTKTRLEQEFELAKQYIDQVIIKENQSMDEIISPIYLPAVVPETPLKIKWNRGEKDYITKDGIIQNEDLTEPVIYTIEAEIIYENEEERESIYYPVNLRIFPKEWTREELLTKEFLIALEQSDKKTKKAENMKLPDKTDKYRFHYEEKEEKVSEKILLLGIFVGIVIFKAMDLELEKKKKKQEQEMLLDYPEIVNKITLLLGAGMTMKKAWGRITEEYVQKNEKRYAYEEMLITWNELKNGVIESNAYINFGNRIKLLPYLKLGSMLSQNVKKGSKGLLDLLEMEAVESYEDRKDLAKRLGEEAGTKLLLPMGIMLVIVLVIIMVPAFRTFAG